MRRTYLGGFLFALSVVVFLGCKAEQPPIPPSKMESIIMDVQTAEIYSTMAGRDSINDYIVKNQDSLSLYYASIFKHHNITADQFRTAIDWYRAHPDLLDTMYVHLLPTVDNLNVGRRR